MFKLLKRIFAVILMIVAIICFILATIVSLGFTLPFLAAVSASTWIAIGCLAVAVAYIVDADTASKYMTKVSKAVADVTRGVGSAIGSGLRGLVSGTGILPLIFIIGGGYLLYKSVGDSNDFKNES